MNREEAIEAIKVMQAWADGKEVEKRLHGKIDWEPHDSPQWDWTWNNYRIKPTAKLRPWTADEVPAFSLMRQKASPNHEWLLMAVGNDDIRSDFLNNYEHSTDGGKTWKPCGVEEVQ